MTHTRKNRGVCSRSTTVTIENGIIQNVRVDDGCDGNLKAVCSLLQGMPAQQAIERMQNLVCGNKKTSCPAQIAMCIQEALQTENR